VSFVSKDYHDINLLNNEIICLKLGGGIVVMIVGFTSTYAISTVPIGTNVVSSNSSRAIQH
jgi:hypothetical protein